jgi:mortality factor 4-like protein 1
MLLFLHRWDEWLDDTRILAWNEENLALQKRIEQFYSTKKGLLKKNGLGSSSPTSLDPNANRKRTREELEKVNTEKRGRLMLMALIYLRITGKRGV